MGLLVVVSYSLKGLKCKPLILVMWDQGVQSSSGSRKFIMKQDDVSGNNRVESIDNLIGAGCKIVL